MPDRRNYFEPFRAWPVASREATHRAKQRANERVELEKKIMQHRQWTRRVTDDEFLSRLREQIAELERKLREIDEQGPPQLA
jgi:hypothetical protein